MTQILPGNVAYMIAGQFASPEQIVAIQTKLGLNDPPLIQYGRWLAGILHGDFGLSLRMDRPIRPLLSEALQRSLVLATASFAIVAVFGIWIGVYSALRRGRAADAAVSLGTYVFISMPEFFWAILLIMLFAGTLGWLPASGYAPVSEGVGRWILHLVLPSLTLAGGLIAHVSRLTRASMIETLNSQYVRVARAKGIPERWVIYGHALRNALIPTVTVLAIDVGVLLGGVVVVESVFSYPGLGRLLIYSIEQKDIPLIQACMLIVTAIYALANLGADLCYALLNPRIRYGRASP
jgi:peptide/nickel transport system permease protein